MTSIGYVILIIILIILIILINIDNNVNNSDWIKISAPNFM